MPEDMEWDEPVLPEKEESEAEIEEQDLDLDIKKYGGVDQDTLEGMLVGYLIKDEDIAEANPKLCDPRNADEMIEAGISGEMFENKVVGDLFDDMMGYYKSHRTLMSLEDARQFAMLSGGTNDNAMNYADALARCHAAVITRQINIRLLIDRFKNHHGIKSVDSIYKGFIEDRAKDPRKAIENFRNRVQMDLSDPEGEPLKEYDFADDVDDTVNWLLDMKLYPEKYKGPTCGIPPVDQQTTGFHPGQLTIFVGRHGGFKTTMMINVAYGLFARGYNVLYASLEMEARLMNAKFLCRHSRELFRTRHLRWSKMYRGLISQPEDWERRKELIERVSDESLSDKQRDQAQTKLRILNETLDGVTQGEEEMEIVNRTRADIKARQNKLKICNVGQSRKIKVSQLEKWIEDRRETWQPDVVIVDYLALVDSDVTFSNRRDLEVGEVCKRFRSMGQRGGYHVISAAQFKMAAIERIRKSGYEDPSKAQFGTDDIAESNQIGADADSVGMLWPIDGGNAVQLVWPKARHQGADSVGARLEVDQDSCTIADDIQSTMEIAQTIPISVGFESARRLADGEALGPKMPEGGDDFETWFDGAPGDVDDGSGEDLLDELDNDDVI